MGKALVVGAAGGVGLELTRQLLDGGWQVLATVLDDAEEATLKKLAPGVAVVLQLDLSQADTIAGRLQGHLEGVTAVAVCAASGPVGPLELIPLASLRRTFEINTIAAVALYQACMPALRASRGRILFTSSFAGKVGLTFVGAYSGSKHALEGLADAMRREAAPFGVDVIVVEPGGIRTTMVAGQVAAAKAGRAALSAEQQAQYGSLFDTFGKVLGATAQAGLEPAVVAHAMLSALTAEKPEARYVVGDDALFMCKSVAAMPEAQQDQTLAAFLGQIANG